MEVVKGFVAPGFEGVQDLFRKLTDVEGPAQLCVYFEDQVVVDLCRLNAKKPNYALDSLQLVMSSSKVLAAIAVALTVENSNLDYTDKIAEFWPGFREKELTVADVMRHEAGLVRINAEFDLADFYPDNLSGNSVGKTLGDQESDSGHVELDGSRQRHYHVFTFGYFAGEICRRKDPLGRTLGRILKDKFRDLDIDCHIGVDDDNVMRRIVSLDIPGPGSMICTALARPFGLLRTVGYMVSGYKNNIVLPRFQNGTITMRDQLPFLYNRHRLLPCFWRDPTTEKKQFLGPLNAGKFLNSKEYLKSEHPGANAVASARGLAKVAGLMANKGTMRGQTLMTEKTWNRMHVDEKINIEMDMGGMRTQFSQGGINHFVSYDDDQKIEEWFKLRRDGFRGWMGIGGSICQYHTELKIGFGFVPHNCKAYDLWNTFGGLLQEEVVRCIRKRRETNHG